MAQSRIIQHFFGSGEDLDPEGRFDLGRETRSKRLREIHSILRKHHYLRGFTPIEFREILEELGPSFVKIGQTLSTRSEILPKAYCDELAKLQTDCAPLPFRRILNTLADIYGEEFDELFVYVDPHPLGSASLAQVHRAVLADGQVVAVKVQRPGVKATMAQDIDIMRSLVDRLSRFLKQDQMLNYKDVVEEMWATFLEETDFAREAANLIQFKEQNKDCAFVDCPEVYEDLCGEFVLVMEYIDGIPIGDHEALVQAGYDLNEIGLKILDNYASQILEQGFFHADPHPGNMMIRDGKIIYIDLGIMGRLTPMERAGFQRIIRAVGMQDSAELKDALLSFAVVRDNNAINHTKFLADVDALLESYASCGVSDLDVGRFLEDVMVLTRSSKATLPSSVTNVARGIVAIEGTVQEFIPNDSIVSIINAHLQKTTDPAEAMKESMQEMLLHVSRASQGAMQAAAYSGEALKMLTRGQLKVNMEMLGSEEPMTHLSRIINRLSIAMIIAGLFIGSAMFAQLNIGPLIMDVPIVSFLGFAGALVLSVWLIIDIWRRK